MLGDFLQSSFLQGMQGLNLSGHMPDKCLSPVLTLSRPPQHILNKILHKPQKAQTIIQDP